MNELFRRLLNLPPQASSVARELDTLHYVVISVTMLGAFAVALVAGYFLVRYRRAENETRERSSANGFSASFEISGIVGLFGLFVAFWIVGFRQFVRLQTPPSDALPVYVSGKQWMWVFAYPNGASSNAVLYVPARRAIKLVLTSRDVIHSFYVPSFRLKQDVVPGRVTTLWFEAATPGTYPVYCAEYCGLEHSRMRAQVVALSDADYENQLDRLRTTPTGQGGPHVPAPSLAVTGERIAAEYGCLRCHTVDGAPHLGPTWAGAYGAVIELQDGQRLMEDEAYLTESMMEPEAKVRRGFQPIMPSYRGLLGAPEVGALVEFIRSLKARGASPPLAPPPADGGLQP